MMPSILAFTSPQVQRLTGLSARQIEYWDATHVYGPTYKDDRPNRAYRRIYTFRDVVSLRTLATLRTKYHVSLEELRRTGQYLSGFPGDTWTQRFWVQNRRVLFHHPQSGQLIDRHGQTSYVDLAEIWAEVEAETAGWTRRDPDDVGQITRHRHVQHNRWVIKGTRIPTSTVWSFHKSGFETQEIIQQYPTLQVEDVEAALNHERQLQAVA